MNSESVPSQGQALVAIDLGAESCRVSMLQWCGDTPRIELIKRFANTPVQRLDGLRWDMSGILRNLEDGLRLCAESAPEGIAAIAVDGWAVDYVRLNKRGERVADPFCYRDRRTAEGERILLSRVGADRMRSITGIQLLPINTANQLASDEPPIKHLPWVNLPEYVLHALGGRVVSESTNASHTQLLTVDERWSDTICAGSDTPIESCPEIVRTGTYVGKLQGTLAALPALSDTRLIAPACHDTASAVAAIPDQGDDWAYISSGTWSLVGTVLAAPLNTPGACRAGFANLRGAGGCVCFHKNVNGMWILRQCIEAWKTEGRLFTYSDLFASVSETEKSEHLIDVDEPELLLPGGMPERINAQLHKRGLPKLDSSANGASTMVNLILRSLASRYADVLNDLSHVTGKKFRKLHIMGGGSQNALLNRFTAEATGLTVCLAGTECSTVGNFAIQLASLENGGTPNSQQICRWARRLALTGQN